MRYRVVVVRPGEKVNRVTHGETVRVSRSEKLATAIPRTSDVTSSDYKKTSNKWKSLTKAVTFCIAKDAIPISTVEKPGFLNLLNQFDQHYTPPSRKTISKITYQSFMTLQARKFLPNWTTLNIFHLPPTCGHHAEWPYMWASQIISSITPGNCSKSI